MNSFQPYYAVIFSSYLSRDTEGYSEMSEKMVDLVRKQEGYLGHESARDGIGITVSYWDSLESIKKWKQNEEHLFAQSEGRNRWYQSYRIRICKVEREYEGGGIKQTSY